MVVCNHFQQIKDHPAGKWLQVVKQNIGSISTWMHLFFSHVCLGRLQNNAREQCTNYPLWKLHLSPPFIFQAHSAAMINPDEAMKTPLSRPSATFQLKVGARSSDAPHTESIPLVSCDELRATRPPRAVPTTFHYNKKNHCVHMHHVLGAPL